MTRRTAATIGIVSVAVLAATAGWLLRDAALARLWAASGPATEAAPSPDELPSPPARTSADHRIESERALELEASALDPSRPLVLDLSMPDEARGLSGVRPVQVLASDGRRLYLAAAPDGPPGSGLQIAIEPDWLVPGRYLVSVETQDRSHFPARRYTIVVR